MAPRRQKKDRYDDKGEFLEADLENELDDVPPTIDPYEELGLQTEASAEDVKRAYRKLALLHHPDKAPESEKAAANQKFQQIAFAYAILSDEQRRKRYDLTGSTAETLEDDDDFDWLTFYREQFDDLVTEQNIKRIRDEYKDSAEERKDILEAYIKYKGKLDSMYGMIMLSDILEDDDRFRRIIDEEIEKGTIELFPAYERETDALREKAKAGERKRREAFDKAHGKDAADKAKAKQKSKKDKSGGLGDLAALIQQRQKSRAGNFLDNLEARYAPKSKARKKVVDEEEPSEEAFQAAQARLSKPKRERSSRAPRNVISDEDAEEDIEGDNVDLDEQSGPPKKRARRKQNTT